MLQKCVSAQYLYTITPHSCGKTRNVSNCDYSNYTFTLDLTVPIDMSEKSCFHMDHMETFVQRCTTSRVISVTSFNDDVPHNTAPTNDPTLHDGDSMCTANFTDKKDTVSSHRRSFDSNKELNDSHGVFQPRSGKVAVEEINPTSTGLCVREGCILRAVIAVVFVLSFVNLILTLSLQARQTTLCSCQRTPEQGRGCFRGHVLKTTTHLFMLREVKTSIFRWRFP